MMQINNSLGFLLMYKTITNKILIRLNLEIQLTIKMSKKTERRFGVILAPFSSKECNGKDNLYVK